jgi:HK97 family phage portal protein
MWPFRRQDAAPPNTKSASFLLGVPVGRGLPANANYTLLAKEGYSQNCVAFACVNRIASAISSVEPQLYKRTGAKLDKIEKHPLLDLMESQNPAQSGKEFLQQLVTHRLTGGNAFVYGVGMEANLKEVRELYLLHPAHMTVKPGKRVFPEKYEYKPSGEVITYPVDPLTGKSAVLHLKSVNPLDPWVGLSPMLAAAYAIDIHNEGQQWNRRLLENDARPSGALVMKGQDGNPATLTDDQYARLKTDIDQQYSGSQNAGRPMLLEGGLEWQEMSLSAKDMDFLEAKNSAANDIGLVFGVPPQLLGIPGAQTFANYEQANLSFWTDTVLPQLSLILEGFNRWLTPIYGDDLFLWYDENAIDALEPLRKAKFDRMNTTGFYSVNEKRRATNADDIEGGDVVLVPSTSIPLDLAGMSLSEPGSPAGQPPAEDDEEEEA